MPVIRRLIVILEVWILAAAGILLTGGAVRAQISPSSAQIVFMFPGVPGDGNVQEVFTMNLDGSNRTQITNDGLNKFLPHFSPDGTRLLYTKFLVGKYGDPNAQTDVVVYDFASAKETLLTHTGRSYQPVWSADGQRIAYFTSHGSFFGQNPSLWIMNADGSNVHQIGAPSGALDDKLWGDLAWSSGDWILFSVAQYTNNCFKVRLDKIRPDGASRTQVTDGGPNCTPFGMEQSGDADPGFSADGKTIYSSRGFPRAPAAPFTGTERRLYSFSSDAWTPGKVETDLSLPSAPDCIEGVPKGSPDGTRVLLFRACAAEAHAGVTLTDTTGSYRTWITDGFGPDWNPVAAMSPTQSPSQQAQTIWFSPIIPAAWNNGGSSDYLDLFAPGAPWTTASAHVQIFKMYTQMLVPAVPGSFSADTLQQIFAYLKSHNIALALEFGPLTPSAQCGAGVEGFAGEVALPVATRIQQLGGNLQYIGMDEPFYFGSLFSGANACNWTAQQVAANAVQNIAQIKSVFPNVIVGDIEPVPATADWLNQYAGWMDAWRAAAGAPLPFFHFDVNWSVDWRVSVESLRKALVKRGIPFGIIYNGWISDSTDAQWIDDAENHYVQWEAQGGAIPNHVIFQSWYPYPTHALPESDPAALTHLIDSYFRQRTTLSMSAASASASGKLLDSQGGAIASAPIVVTAQATSGPGNVSTYVLSGTVPAGITTGVIQTCVNQCGDVGATDINVFSFQYADAGGQTSLNFANGLNGWGVEGNGTAVVQAVSDANGKSMQISATAAQQTFVNSLPIRVTPGSIFSLTIQARVSPSSVGSGNFALVFIGSTGTEVSRSTLEFAPPTLALGRAQTAGDGTYSLSFAPPGAGDFQVQAAYSGTSALWPAFAIGPIGTTPSIRPDGVVNAADFKVEPLSPEAWFTIFGQNLGTAAQWTSQNTFSLGGASVSVCGTPALISYNSGPVTTGWQLNALTPDSVTGQTACPVVVTVGGQASLPVTVGIASGILELFVITHADYSLVGPSSPAQPGEELIAWGTGDCATPTIAASGRAATVIFSGRVEPGLCQLNFLVPNGLSGASQLTISNSPSVYALAGGAVGGTTTPSPAHRKKVLTLIKIREAILSDAQFHHHHRHHRLSMIFNDGRARFNGHNT